MRKKDKETKEPKEPYSTPQRDGYRAIDISMSFKEGNIYGTIMAVFLFAVVMAIAGLIHGMKFYTGIYEQQRDIEIACASWIYSNTGISLRAACIFGKFIFFLFVVAFLFILVLVHELIHKNTWALWISKADRKKVLSIGFKSMMPYASCTADLPMLACFWGTIMPMVLTGIVIAAISIATANPLLSLYGAVGVSAGGGDLIMAIRMLPYLKYHKIIDRALNKDNSALASDLEDRMGCVIYIPLDAYDVKTGKIINTGKCKP